MFFKFRSSICNVQKAGHSAGPEKLLVDCPTFGNTFTDWNHSLEGCPLHMHLLNANWVSVLTTVTVTIRLVMRFLM